MIILQGRNNVLTESQSKVLNSSSIRTWAFQFQHNGWPRNINWYNYWLL